MQNQGLIAKSSAFLDVYSFPFGVTLEGRNFTLSGAENYRYGFQGQETDDEVKGKGNSVDFGARMHDPRVGRWQSTDPLETKYPSISPYAFAVNSPIRIIDYDGQDIIDFLKTAAAYTRETTPALTNSTEFMDYLGKWAGNDAGSRALGYTENGEFSSIKLHFAIDKTMGKGHHGNTGVYYDDQNILSMDNLPEVVDASKLEVRIRLNPYSISTKDSDETIDDIRATRLVTQVHELTVHAENQAQMILDNTHNGVLDLKQLQIDVKERYGGEGNGPDHDLLESGGNMDFDRVGKDVTKVIANDAPGTKLNRFRSKATKKTNLDGSVNDTFSKFVGKKVELEQKSIGEPVKVDK